MSFTYLALSVVALLVGLVLAGDTVRLDSFAQQCEFMVDGNKFNLCPLLKQESGLWSIGNTRNTPPTVTSSWYRISLDGPLARNASKPADMQVGRNCRDNPT
jgi:hypothetical protein